jgi:hypothetical protein
MEYIVSFLGWLSLSCTGEYYPALTGLFAYSQSGTREYFSFWPKLSSPHRLHCKKSFSIFPSPAGMSLTKLFLGGNNDVIYKLFPPRESLVSVIPAGDGNIEKLF